MSECSGVKYKEVRLALCNIDKQITRVIVGSLQNQFRVSMFRAWTSTHRLFARGETVFIAYLAQQIYRLSQRSSDRVIGLGLQIETRPVPRL